MAKIIRKRKGRVEKSLFGCRFATMKVEHTGKNKVCIQSGNVPISP
jgi:hypothetical protein